MKKISSEKFYHIYLKDKCVYSYLDKEKFNNTYDTMRAMVGMMKTDYSEEDITFEVVETTANLEEHSY